MRHVVVRPGRVCGVSRRFRWVLRHSIMIWPVAKCTRCVRPVLQLLALLGPELWHRHFSYDRPWHSGQARAGL